MRRILFIGCGDIALRTATLLPRHLRLYGLIRTASRATHLRQRNIRPVAGDLDSAASLGRLAGLADIVVHLAPPQSDGDRDQRTRKLLQALTKRGSLPQGLVYISTSGVYGDSGGARVEETRRLAPATSRAKRRADAEQQLRRWALSHKVALCILRVPGIYAGDRLPEKRIRDRIPAVLPAEDSYTNHIHADDLARTIVRAMYRLAGIRSYNVVDDSELKMGEYFDLVADALHLPRPPRITRTEATGQISPAMLSFLEESRRLDNRRLKTELRLKLRYPTVQHGLVDVRPATPR